MLTSGQMRVFSNTSATVHCGDLIKRRISVCLFGVPDPVKTEKLYQEQMNLNRTNFSQKWNFDISTGLPSTQATGLRWEAHKLLRVRVDNLNNAVNRGSNEGDNCNNTSQIDGRMSDCCKEEVQLKKLSHKEKIHRSSCNGVRTGRVERCRPSQGSKQMKITDFWPKKKCSHP